MAKDDYDVVVFKILTYLYGCMKRKFLFNKAVFEKLIEKQNVQEEYLAAILRMMTSEGLIEGLVFTKAWGNTYIIANDYSDMSITANGIRYLNENSGMAKARKVLSESTGIIGELIKIVFTL